MELVSIILNGIIGVIGIVIAVFQYRNDKREREKKKTEDKRLEDVKQTIDGELPGFIIYMDISGQKDYLMFNRHNGLLYMLLKDGVAFSDLQRWSITDIAKRIGVRPGGSRSDKLFDNVKHVRKVVESYLEEWDIA